MQASTAALTDDRASGTPDVLTSYLDDGTAIPVDTGSRKGDPRRERPIAELNKEVFRTVRARQLETPTKPEQALEVYCDTFLILEQP